jgi:hypothetical protein
MEQFRVYLRAELGKLKDKGDARDFINALDPELLRDMGLPSGVAVLQARFACQDAVAEFVGRLTDHHLCEVTRCCDYNWRNNGVYKRLTCAAQWVITEVPAEFVDVQQAERCLGEIFRRHNWKLIEIAHDEDLLNKKPYCLYEAGKPVAYPVLLALQKGNRFRVFDGIHRAIQLIRNGETVLRLCHPRA